jgi:hypothetical protein
MKFPSVLDAFTAACFNQVLKKVDALRRRFEEEVVEVPEKSFRVHEYTRFELLTND